MNYELEIMNYVDVDKAWRTVYSRLERENLLLEENKKQQNFFTFRKIAAAILLFLLSGFAVFFIQLQTKDNTLLSRINDHHNTLVTTLQDGSIVYLSRESSLYYPEKFSANERKIKIKGSAMFDVSPDVNRPFRVETEHISVKVLGTEFGINDTENKSAFELFVERGKVEVTDKASKESVFVEAGEIVRIKSGRLSKQKNIDSGKAIVFTQKMRFKDENLGHILKVIQNTTGTKIVLSNRKTANHTLTVTFDNNSADSMVELICKALDLNYIRQTDGIYISE